MSNTIERLNSALTDRYAIEREIGAGGMATVYVAHDIRHDRPVALKVLRPELAAVIGAERFLNEIRVTANLQHPNILPLYDSGEADSFLFYVMPVVDGESLRDLLDRETQLSIDDTVRITGAVAAALGYAHRHEVIHRDIKPENILLHDGQPLIADFGIALAVTEAGAERLTETGLSIGTPHYMSPEQALGERTLDGRSDVYSLGCVAYEMLTGEPPHTGPTAQAIIAKIATETPRPVGAVRSSTPPALASAIEVALEKLPADRFATAEQFATALTNQTARFTRSHATVPRRKRWATAAIAAALTGIAAFSVGRFTTGPSPGDSVPLARFEIGTPEGNIPASANAAWIDISADGTKIAYVAQIAGEGQGLLVRNISEIEAVRIGGLQGVGSPVFSPDGERIAFSTPDGDVRSVSINGGQPVRVVSGPRPADITWARDGSILLGEGPSQTGAEGRPGVFRVPREGVESQRITDVDTLAGEFSHSFPQLLPDGRLLVMAVNGSAFANRVLAVIDPNTGAHTIIGPGVRGMYASSGHLVWAEPDGRLRASAFDLEQLELTGPTVTLAQDVHGATGDGVAQFDVSDHGQLIYVAGQPRELVVVDRAGRVTQVLDRPRFYHSPRFSPDGRSIVMDIADPTGRDLWTIDLADETPLKITFTGNVNDPIWAPDGRSVTFSSTIADGGGYRGLFQVVADGSSPPESLFVGTDADHLTGSWFPDGSHLIAIATQGIAWQLETISMLGDRTPLPFPGARPLHAYPAVSPDGNWLAYQSYDTGRPEVLVRRLDGSEGRVVVSRDGGTAPVWHPSGRELFYRHVTGSEDVLISAQLDPGPPLRVTSRTELFSTRDMEPANPHANYDVHPDGDRFVMVRLRGGTEIIYIQNWTAVFDQP